MEGVVHFNGFLVSGTEQARHRLTLQLEKLNGFLEGEDQIYVIKDSITYGDCYLMPRLHHIKVAGREFADYEIPEQLFYVWRYLYEAYKTDAFQKTCPTDPDIIKHYEKKAKVFKPKKGVPSLQKSTYSFDIPETVLEALENQPPRGGAENATEYEDYTHTNMMTQGDVEEDNHVYETEGLEEGGHSFQEESTEDAIYDDPDLVPVGAPVTEPLANATPERMPSPEPMQTASPARSASPVEIGSVEPLEAPASPTEESSELAYEDPDDYTPPSLPPLPAEPTPAVDSEYTVPEESTTAAQVEVTPVPDYDGSPTPDYDGSTTPETSTTPTPDYDATPKPDYETTPKPDYETTPQPDYDPTPHADEVPAIVVDPASPAPEEDTTEPTYQDDSTLYENVEAKVSDPSSNTKSLDFTVSGKAEDTPNGQVAEVRVNGTNVNGHD